MLYMVLNVKGKFMVETADAYGAAVPVLQVKVLHYNIAHASVTPSEYFL